MPTTKLPEGRRLDRETKELVVIWGPDDYRDLEETLAKLKALEERGMA